MTLMADEIAEQPVAVARTLEALLPLRPEVRRVAAGRRLLLFVARGSSDNAAIYGRYLLEATVGVTAALAAPSIATHYRRERDLSDALVVSLSQSGRTEEIVETQRWARRCGAATLAVTNHADSPLAAGADLALVTRAGDERAVPATKSYTAQLSALAVLASSLEDGDTLAKELTAVPDAVGSMLDTDVEAVVDVLARARETLVTGRGICLGTALETGLKLEETCLRPVRGLSYADLRHGPFAVVDPDVTAVVVAPGDGPLLAPLTELTEQLRDRGASVVGIGGDQRLRAACHAALPGPGLTETVAPLALVVPAQLAVESLARRLGLDPDSPRGLSKVTQTDPDQPDSGGVQ